MSHKQGILTVPKENQCWSLLVWNEFLTQVDASNFADELNRLGGKNLWLPLTDPAYGIPRYSTTSDLLGDAWPSMRPLVVETLPSEMDEASGITQSTTASITARIFILKTAQGSVRRI